MHSHTSSDVDHSLANEFMTAQSERVTEHELAAAAHIIINVKRAERSSQWSQSVMRMLHVGSGLLGLLTFRIPSLNTLPPPNDPSSSVEGAHRLSITFAGRAWVVHDTQKRGV
ncbi:hypothetical protein AB1N83_013342 [Pleurotus pulmonarius]